MAGIIDAQHAEYDTTSGTLLITPLACAIPGPVAEGPRLNGARTITLAPGSRLSGIYGQPAIAETFTCSYGLNPDFQETLTTAGLRITATDEDGEVRAVEIPSHRFFLATLFLPQYTSTPEEPHPLITAYLEAALHDRRGRDSGRHRR